MLCWYDVGYKVLVRSRFQQTCLKKNNNVCGLWIQECPSEMNGIILILIQIGSNEFLIFVKMMGYWLGWELVQEIYMFTNDFSRYCASLSQKEALNATEFGCWKKPIIPFNLSIKKKKI